MTDYTTIKDIALRPIVNGWDLRPFAELADFKNGLNYSAEDIGSGIKLIGIRDFWDAFSINYDNLNRVRVSKNIDSSYFLEEGDLLFVRSNGNKALIGRVLYLNGINGRITHSGFTIRARINKQIMLPAFAAYYFTSPLVKKQFHRFGGGTNISNLTQSLLENIVLPVPPREEQVQIVKILECWRIGIEKVICLLKLKRRLKRGLMQQVLSGRRRFTEFTSRPWQPTSLSTFFAEKSIANLDGSVIEVLSCTKKGILRQVERFGKRLASIRVNNYKVVHRGDFVYDPMLLWDASMGFVRCVEKGIVSPAYATFSFTGNDIDRAFCDLLFASHMMRHQYKVISQGTNARRRKALPVDFLKLAPLMPSTEIERTCVSEIFGVLDREINLLTQQLAALREQKKGLMQKLLTGQVRVNVDKARLKEI
ncbi:MAG TPA: restriction endonuclease subunit S [Phycisphaerae bacterium]|nr:restriction endonuclease subunit S [Phycisphaerae bacterium]